MGQVCSPFPDSCMQDELFVAFYYSRVRHCCHRLPEQQWQFLEGVLRAKFHSTCYVWHYVSPNVENHGFQPKQLRFHAWALPGKLCIVKFAPSELETSFVER